MRSGHPLRRLSMNHLRSHRLTRLCVLVLHLLVMGVASASPWLRPDDGRLAVRCSASGLATAGADDDATPSLDCPLCLPLQAPPAHAALPVTPSTPDEALVAAHTDPGHAGPTVLPPARAPPRV